MIRDKSGEQSSNFASTMKLDQPAIQAEETQIINKDEEEGVPTAAQEKWGNSKPVTIVANSENVASNLAVKK